MSIASGRALPRRRARHWKHPGVFAGLAVLVLAGIAFGVNDAIESYHDRIALRGLDGKPSPISLIVAGEPMVIPANMIRFREERRGGPLDQVDLIFHWPSLEGFSDERADDFRNPSPTAPLIYATISARENSLDSTARIDSIYARFFEGPEITGPGGLVGHALNAESGYGGEIVYYEPQGATPFVARCPAEATTEIPATCIRDVNTGQGLSMLYRFNQTYLADWRTMDDRLRRLVGQFFRKP